MQEIDVPISPDAHLENAETIIERCCAAEDLKLTLKGTLVMYSGCTHWHYKRARQRGTLEITFWPEQRHIWFKVSDGRQGEWINKTTTRISACVQAQIGATNYP